MRTMANSVIEAVTARQAELVSHLICVRVPTSTPQRTSVLVRTVSEIPILTQNFFHSRDVYLTDERQH